MEAQKVAVGAALLIHKEDQILLIRRKNVLGSGSWSTPGGHLDFGETPEDCARREAMEETGLQVKNIRFVAVTNDVFPAEGRHYITFWMEGNYETGEAQVNAPDEMDAAGWFSKDALPAPLFLPLKNLLEGKTYPERTGKSL